MIDAIPSDLEWPLNHPKPSCFVIFWSAFSFGKSKATDFKFGTYVQLTKRYSVKSFLTAITLCSLTKFAHLTILDPGAIIGNLLLKSTNCVIQLHPAHVV